MTDETEVLEMTCSNSNGLYSICVDETKAETIWELHDLVLRPLLLAMGYQPGTLDKLFGMTEDEDESFPIIDFNDFDDDYEITYTRNN